MEVIVINERVVSEYLGFKVKVGEDLIKNPKCEKFIKENKQYLTSVESKEFIEFFKKTGIIVEHYILKGKKRFNFLGLKLEYLYKIFNCHLFVVDKENIVEIKKDVLYLNENKIRNIKNETKEQEDRFNKFKKISEKLENISINPGCCDNFDNEKEYLIIVHPDYCYSNYISKKNTEQLVISPYNDIFTLTSDGVLYCNNDVYAKDVEYIFEQDIINKIIIYKNKNVEYLTASFGNSYNVRCDKVLYNNDSLCNYLAILKDKKLKIINKTDDNYINNKSCNTVLYGIDDIEFNTYDKDELLLKIGKEKFIYYVSESSINEINK